jgi:hypothetical protein
VDERQRADDRRHGTRVFFFRRRIEHFPKLCVGGKIWEPKKKWDLPKADNEYLALEAARFWGYTLSQWEEEPEHLKARAMAHHWEYGLRKSYADELQMESMKDNKPEPGKAVTPNWSHFRQGGGLQ